MNENMIEAEVIRSEERALTVADTVTLPIPVDEAIWQWEQYQELTHRLLDESDYQKIGNRKFKKKSAWRKYARAFNITDRVTHEEIVRDSAGFPIFARLRVEARAINGRTAEADQECHVTERCCEQPCRKSGWREHTCCSPTCDGKRHWSHPGDLPATALTRAKNRAISDLIGAGEVSAEEMESERGEAARPDAERFAAPPADGPPCPNHGNRPVKLIPAGVSRKTGKEYGAFWTCQGKGSDVGTGKPFSMFADAWKAQQSQQHATEPDASKFDELPNE